MGDPPELMAAGLPDSPTTPRSGWRPRPNGWSNTTRGRSWKPQSRCRPCCALWLLAVSRCWARTPSRPGASSRRHRTSARAPPMLCTPGARDRNRSSGTCSGSPANRPLPRWTAKVPDDALCVVWESVRAEDLAGRLAVMRATCQPGSRSGTDQLYPVCVAYQGDSPVEYPSEENPREPEPFSIAEVNGKVARLGR
jgi:hypothetical protein